MRAVRWGVGFRLALASRPRFGFPVAGQQFVEVSDLDRGHPDAETKLHLNDDNTNLFRDGLPMKDNTGRRRIRGGRWPSKRWPSNAQHVC